MDFLSFIYACHRNTSSFQCWNSSHLCLLQEQKQFSIMDFVLFMLVTATQAYFYIRFRLIYACHRNTSIFQYWILSHLCVSHEHKQFFILAFVLFMLVTGAQPVFNVGFRLICACHMTQPVFNIGFRLIYTCHRNTSSFQNWISSHLCLS